MEAREIEVRVGGTKVTASMHGDGPVVLVLGHGAGGNRRNPFLLRLASALEGSGRCAILYNFPYVEARRRIPDPPGLLESTVAAVCEKARALGARSLLQGGKSMGGRIASQAVAKGEPSDGLVFLGYPLHPPARQDRLRDAHLYEIKAPMLFIQGTKDAFARWDLLLEVTRRLPQATLHAVEGADHSFHTRKRQGRESREVEEEVFGALMTWLEKQGR